MKNKGQLATATVKMSSKIYSLALGLCIALLSSGITFAACKLQLIESLYRQGKTQQAYQLANQYLPIAEGEPAFDFLYGQIAIDSGDISKVSSLKSECS